MSGEGPIAPPAEHARRATAIVVPCFDEAQRLQPDAFLAACREQPGLRFVFVDDGSRDGTLALLRALADREPAISVVALPRNRGKGEAVRAGVLAALAAGPDYVGWWDADLATPLGELPRFVAVLEARPDCEMVLGARVQMLGRTIERHTLRHYAGRIFATVASQALGLAVYDTQCGAKLLRATPAVAALFAAPFSSRWVFDVELLARLVRQRREQGGTPPAEALYELPLDGWRDVPGSKVRPWELLRALLEVGRIRRRELGRRAGPQDPPAILR